MTVLITQATVLLIEFLAYLKFLNLSSTGRFLNIYHFTTFCLIANMASVKVALLVISFLSLLSLGHPSLEILVKLLLLP